MNDATSRFVWIKEVLGQTLFRVWHEGPLGEEVCRESFGIAVHGPAEGPAMLKIDTGEAPAYLLRFDTLEQAKQAGEAHVALTYAERPTWRRVP